MFYQGIRLSKDVLKSAGIELNEILDVSAANCDLKHKKIYSQKEGIAGILSESQLGRLNSSRRE